MIIVTNPGLPWWVTAYQVSAAALTVYGIGTVIVELFGVKRGD